MPNARERKMVQEESHPGCGETRLWANIFGRGQRDITEDCREKARKEQWLCPGDEIYIHHNMWSHKKNLRESWIWGTNIDALCPKVLCGFSPPSDCSIFWTVFTGSQEPIKKMGSTRRDNKLGCDFFSFPYFKINQNNTFR